MSTIFGPIKQCGYVVTDLDAAINHWVTRLGVGPWFELDTSYLKDLKYRATVTAMKVRIALANSGELQIELIQPLDEEPSPYNDFLLATNGKSGLQHVSSWPEAAVFDRLVAEHPVLFSGNGGGTRFAYLDGAYELGAMMEIADLAPPTQAFFAEIKRAASSWERRTQTGNLGEQT